MSNHVQTDTHTMEALYQRAQILMQGIFTHKLS